MQKIKFKIQGMHCNSCAVLIDEKLKNKPGIIKVKTNYDSQKGIIVFDEEKIGESDIYQTIKEAGDYQVEKIEEPEIPLPGGNLALDAKKEEVQQFSKILSSLKILIGIGVVSLGLNAVLINAVFKQLPTAQFSAKTGQEQGNAAAQGQNLPSQPSAPSNNGANLPTTQTFTITKDSHVRGDFNAPITLVEFSDFECPFCERHYPTLNKILADYKGKVRWVYKHFPLGFHPNAQKAAEASECADEQGKFWEYHDKLFENLPGGYSLEKFKQWAKDLGLNSAKFNDCLDSGKFAQKVKDDFQEGSQKGVDGTPATFVNGQLVSGALPYDSFKQIIDGLLN